MTRLCFEVALFILEKYYKKVDNAHKKMGQGFESVAIMFDERMPYET